MKNATKTYCKRDGEMVWLARIFDGDEFLKEWAFDSEPDADGFIKDNGVSPSCVVERRMNSDG